MANFSNIQAFPVGVSDKVENHPICHCAKNLTLYLTIIVNSENPPASIAMFPAVFRATGGRIAARAYHSSHHANSNLIIDNARLESKVLNQAITHIPRLGFSSGCVTTAIRDLGYPDSLQSLFSSGSSSVQYQLCLHWLKYQRQKLNHYILDPTNTQFHTIADEYDRVEHLINTRLHYNKPALGHMTSLLSQLVIPYNVPQSMGELHNLSDDIAYFAGDASNDFAWYSKRLAVSSIYVSAELYQISDGSEDLQNTKNFVKQKVSDLKGLGSAYNDVEQWSVFTAISLANLIRSQLIRG